MVKNIDNEIRTVIPQLNRVWARYAQTLLEKPGLLIADREDDLNWHAFLGHSLDMQGFRAAEFAGVDKLTRTTFRGFLPLNQRGIGVKELASLWDVPGIRDHLLFGTKGAPLSATCQVLRGHGGSCGNALADAFETFPWRRFHWSIRGLLQNSAVLKQHQYSFRRWLQNECTDLGVADFPPRDFKKTVTFNNRAMTLESALCQRLQAEFYRVGPEIAPYMLCDWQLWLWNEAKTDLFESFKLDSFHKEFIRRYGKGVIPMDKQGFVRWWHEQVGCEDFPPRLANECIWMGIQDRVV